MTDPQILELRERIERIELSAGIPRKPWKAQPAEQHEHIEPGQAGQRRGPGRPRKVADG